ncbi:MAG: haloalkane dehalogenase [Acidimicrobiales bacterium]|nr:MAG: haloalkane dehalogenase [Acidimicrobiales bacterium]
MRILRTPDDRFVDLPDFPFEPRYVQVPSGDGETLRVHYVDEGDPDGPVVLMLHGEPSWSFLYRKMIPTLVDAGLRAIAVDLVGFGRSDKPAERSDYTYARHVFWTEAAVFGQLELRDVTLVCQDWGGLVGLRMLAAHPERFARVVAANTFLPTGDRAPGDAFMAWRRFSQETPEFPVSRIIQAGCVNRLPEDVARAYDAPFPSEEHKAGARQFPLLVPITPDDPEAEANRRAWQVLERLETPFLTAFSDSDPITAGADAILRERIPGARGMPHTTIEGAGHFLQEDRGEELARVVVSFVEES